MERGKATPHAYIFPVLFFSFPLELLNLSLSSSKHLLYILVPSLPPSYPVSHTPFIQTPRLYYLFPVAPHLYFTPFSLVSLSSDLNICRYS